MSTAKRAPIYFAGGSASLGLVLAILDKGPASLRSVVRFDSDWLAYAGPGRGPVHQRFTDK